MSNAEQDYLDALERLVNNKPKNTGLAKKAKLGVLKINISNVALEAGRSRTAIATSDTKFHEVRARILEQMAPVAKTNTSIDVIKILRSKNAELTKENSLLWSENANILKQLHDVNGQMERMRKALKRSQKSFNKSTNTVVPLYSHSSDE